MTFTIFISYNYKKKQFMLSKIKHALPVPISVFRV